MGSKKPGCKKTGEFEASLREKNKEQYVLRLYVAGMTEKSKQAVEEVKKLCRENLAGRYKLEVIDIYQNPIGIKKDQIVAIPTLIKELPPPLKRLIGAMSDEMRILAALGLEKAE